MFKVQLWKDMSLLFPFHVLRGASLSGVPLLCRCLGHPKKGDFDEWRGVLREESSLSHRSWLDDLELRSLQMMKRWKSQPLKTQKARLKIGGRRKVWLFVLFVLDTILNPFYTHPIPTPTFNLVDIIYDPVTGESRQPDQSSFPEASLRFEFFGGGVAWSYTKNHQIDNEACMGVSKNRGFSPQIIHFHRVFHYKPSILGYHYSWKHPHGNDLKNFPRFMVAYAMNPTTDVWGVWTWMCIYEFRSKNEAIDATDSLVY